MVDVNAGVVSVADAVANELRTRLLTGHYEPDAEIRDTELTDEFSVSRPTVRVAVQTLVAEGLLERGRGRSARVRSFTADDSIDLYRVRTMIELSAIRMIMTEKIALDGLITAAERYTQLDDDVKWDQVAEADINFHREAVAASGSPRLLRAFNTLSAESRLLVAHLRPDYGGARQLAAEHAALVELLAGGRMRQAQVAWREHLDDGLARYLKLIEARAARLDADKSVVEAR